MRANTRLLVVLHEAAPILLYNARRGVPSRSGEARIGAARRALIRAQRDVGAMAARVLQGASLESYLPDMEAASDASHALDHP